MVIDPAIVQAEEGRIRQAYAHRSGGERYSWLNAGHLFSMQELERQVLSALRRHGLAPLQGKRILEVGCGGGFWLREFVKWGARPDQVVGVDLLPHRIQEARTRCPAGVRLQCSSATHLAFAAESFDVVLQATVFTSILIPEVRRAVAAEMVRVVKPDGAILWYDFFVNNPRNPDVRAVTAREIRTLFPGCAVALQRVTLAPPLARALAPLSWLICSMVGAVPLLRTHYLGVIRPTDRF